MCVFTTGSKSTSPVEQLYTFEEDLPSLTWTHSQEVEQGPLVPGQHTSSQDLRDNGVTLSTSASLGTEFLKHGPPMESGLADTWYSSSVHQLPQCSLSLPQISDIAMGSSAPELTSIAQQHVTMMDNYDIEETASVANSDSGVCSAHTKEHHEIKASKCVSLCYQNGMNSVQLCVLYRFKVQICGR